jgi:hypothetical protein
MDASSNRVAMHWKPETAAKASAVHPIGNSNRLFLNLHWFTTQKFSQKSNKENGN